MLIKTAPWIQDVSGRYGDLVFMSSSGNIYGRRFVFPANPQSANQQVVRQILTSLTKEWGEVLTVPQRQSWTDWAGSNRPRNRFGNPVSINGISAWLQCGSITWMRTGASPVTKSAPTTTEPAPPLAIGTVVIDTTNEVLTIPVTMPDPVPGTSTYLLFRLTDGLTSVAINPRPSEYRFIAGTDSDSFKDSVEGVANYEFPLDQIRTAMVDQVRCGIRVQAVSGNGLQSNFLTSIQTIAAA